MTSNNLLLQGCDWWAKSLLNLKFRFKAHLSGIPGRIRIPLHWEVRQPPQADHLFYFVEEGEFHGRMGNTELEFQAGDFAWFPAGTAFHFWLPPDKSLIIHRFRLRAESSKAASIFPAKAMILPGAWACLNWMEQIIAELNHESATDSERRISLSSGDDFRLRGLFLCFFTELERLSKRGDKTAGELTARQKQELLHLAASKTRTWLKPADLSNHLQLSHDYFSRLFGRSFGKPPRRWLLEQRIHQASIRLAESSLNISQIAEEFGYQDVFLFSRQFKNVTGYSPLQFRKRN